MTLRELRLSKNIKQTDLARVIGKTSALVSLWEKGECSPRSKDLQKIADALGVTVVELVECL